MRLQISAAPEVTETDFVVLIPASLQATYNKTKLSNWMQFSVCVKGERIEGSPKTKFIGMIYVIMSCIIYIIPRAWHQVKESNVSVLTEYIYFFLLGALHVSLIAFKPDY